MIKYLFQQVALTVVLFMLWIGTTNLSGGDVGMMPMLMGMLVLIHISIGITLSLIFRNQLKTPNSMLIGIVIFQFIYQLGPLVIGDEPMFWGIFEASSSGEINRAFALIPLVCGILTLITIVIREQKNTFANRV
ncbi:hypothetical protein BFP72_10270 [Reichenbachiella sp. 5M10]|uniref:hypothetical protein n=1 Tax=Reichenbachiella sp. 5M10 TaxID=1889772 RepID=UPI000C158A13|nr:hypothetical protein [Reichenbachiella sp. 5M10]PIB35750.1 hypothetical protein BFP72_10270 [Reichenbachiella sp. 5M10]